MSGFPKQAVTAASIASAGGLLASNNLSDVAATATARTNLGALTLGQAFGQPAWQSGRYYWLPNGCRNTVNTLGVGTLRVCPFWVPNAITLNRLGGEVTLTGDAGSKIRLGIYNDDGTGRPGALVLDAGQIAGDSVAVQQLTINQALASGLYWIGGAVQAVTVTQPTVRCNVPSAGASATGYWPISDAGTAIPGAGATGIGFAQTGVTGALPGTFGTPSGLAGSVPALFGAVA